jgi:hypothetical protein
MVCAVLGLYTLSCIGAGVWRQGLALSIGPNWVGSTWRWKQNPVSETLCLKKTGCWTMSRNIIFVLFQRTVTRKDTYINNKHLTYNIKLQHPDVLCGSDFAFHFLAVYVQRQLIFSCRFLFIDITCFGLTGLMNDHDGRPPHNKHPPKQKHSGQPQAVNKQTHK